MAKCIFCNSKRFDELFRGGVWKTLKCRNCGLVVTKGDGLRPDYKVYHRDEDYVKFEKMYKNIFKKRFNLIKKFKKRGKILDVGASTGTTLEIFKDDGWQVLGIEPSESAEVAKEKGIKMLRATLEETSLPKESFDVVLLNHTLEHVENPLIVLRKAKILLKKGGIIFVDVPNFGSLSSKILGRHWPYLIPDEHTSQFTKETLVKLFRKAGFRVIHFESRSGLFDFANPTLELLQSLIGLKKRFFINIFTAPYALVATLLNMGDSMSMIGQIGL